MKENTMTTNFEPNERVIFVQSTKIGTHENKAIHSKTVIELIDSEWGLRCSIIRFPTCNREFTYLKKTFFGSHFTDNTWTRGWAG